MPPPNEKEVVPEDEQIKMLHWLRTKDQEVKLAWVKYQEWLQRRAWFPFTSFLFSDATRFSDATSLQFLDMQPSWVMRRWRRKWQTQHGQGEGEPKTQAAQGKDGCSLFGDPDDVGEEKVEQ